MKETGAFTDTDFPHGPRGRDSGGGPAAGGSGLALAGFIGLPLLVGTTGAAISAPGINGWYLSLAAPPGTPPNWLFGPVWTIMYVLIGVAAWLVWLRRPKLGMAIRRLNAAGPTTASRSSGGVLRALRLWGWQLLLNAVWAPAFFALQSTALALLVVAGLLVLIALTARAFATCRPVAAALMLPYLIWTCYAAYLTAGFWWLNPRA